MKKIKKLKRLTVPKQTRLRRDKAMPEVKKLVTKHGRIAIQGCLNLIREHEKKLEKLEDLKGEVSRLEKDL
jgi:hypothetical protein